MIPFLSERALVKFVIFRKFGSEAELKLFCHHQKKHHSNEL